MNKYERESVEFQPIAVTRDGVTITTGIETSICASGTRPTVWVTAVLLGGKIGCMVQSLSAGTYQIWVRITDSPEIPVKSAGSIQVT